MALAMGACGGDPGTGGPDGGGMEGLDLAAWVDAPGSAGPGDTLTLRYRVTNVGRLPAVWVGDLRFGHEDTPEAGMELVKQPFGLALLEPGQEVEGTASITLPARVAAGRYQASFRVDAGEDSRPANDRATRAVEVSGGTCAADTYEDDDRPEDAAAYPVGQVMDHNFCFDGVDWGRFEATAGEQLGLRLVGGEAPTWLSIGTPGAMPWKPTLATETPGQAISARWVAPEDGVYHVLTGVEGPYGVGLDYQVALLPARSDPAVEWISQEAFTSAYAGGVAEVQLQLSNDGYAMTDPTEVAWILSADPVLDPADRTVDRHPVPAMAEGDWHYQRAPVVIPADVTPGDWFLFAVVDPDDAVAELLETNNVSEPLSFRVDTPPCPGDLAEDDDRAADAVPVTLGVPEIRNHCDDAHDWVAVEAAAGEGFQVSLAPDHRQTLTLRVVAPDGTEALSAKGAYLSEPFTADAAGTWHLEIGANSVGPDSGYTLTVDRALPDLTAGGWLEAIFTEVRPGGLVEATVNLTNAAPSPSGAFTLRLLLSDQETLDARALAVRDLAQAPLSGGAGRQPTVLVPLPSDLAPGTWHVFARVDPEGALVELDEGNNVAHLGSLTVAAPLCDADPAEEDDLPEEAPLVPLGSTLTGRNHCDDGTDWLRIPVSEGEPIAAILDHSMAGGTHLTRMEIHADGRTLADEIGGELYWVADRTGEVLLCAGCAVEPARAGQTEYALTVDLCPGDAREPDDSQAQARPIAPGETVQGNLCEGTDDWLTFVAQDRVTYRVSAAYVGGGGAVDVTMLDASNQPVAPKGGGYTPGAGTVHLKVDAFFSDRTGLGSDYTLTLE